MMAMMPFHAPSPSMTMSWPTSVTVPTMPSATPTKACHRGRCLLKAQSTRTTSNGSAATITAVVPDSMYCSAQTTVPRPTVRNRKLVVAMLTQCWRVGHQLVLAEAVFALRRIEKYDRIARKLPAVTRRATMRMDGGIVSMASMLAR